VNLNPIEWNLISGGPSRVHLRPEHLFPDPAPTVSVNRGLDVTAQGIKVDFAAFGDGPAGAWDTFKLEQFLLPSTQLWIPMEMDMLRQVKNNEVAILSRAAIFNAWHSRLPAITGIRRLMQPEVPDVDGKAARFAFTTLAALESIFCYSPKRVRILCADMVGSSQEGMSEAESEAYDMEKLGLSRWRHERAALARSIEKAKEKGIEVEFRTPGPTGLSEATYASASWLPSRVIVASATA
jgi:hypothetical protein